MIKNTFPNYAYCRWIASLRTASPVILSPLYPISCFTIALKVAFTSEKSSITSVKSLFHVFENENEEEILQIMAELLKAEGCIDETEAFLSSVKEREKLYSTLYGKIWMPHPLHSFAKKNGIACGLVKNHEKIRLVFMLCLRKEDTSIYNHFFDKIVTILEDEKAFDALCNVDDFEQFERMFESIL